VKGESSFEEAVQGMSFLIFYEIIIIKKIKGSLDRV